MPPSKSSPSRSAAIDLLRVASILWVVGFWHVLDYLPGYDGTKNSALSFVTVACLGLFTLISGYLMGGKQVPLDRLSLRNFYLRRFVRLYPPLALATLVYWIAHLSPPETLIKGALLIAMLWGPPPFTLWFMSMVVLFYAATPFLLAVRRNKWIYCITVSLLAALVLVLGGLGEPVDTRLAIYLPAYAAGLWLASYEVDWRYVTALGVTTALAGVFFAAPALPNRVEASGWLLPWALGAPLMLMGTAMTFEARLHPPRLVALVAEASYFLYLSHRVVYAALLKLMRPASVGGTAALLMLFGLPLALAIAWVGQRIYNRFWRLVFGPGK